MNPDLKQPVSLPQINWDRVLKWSAITAASVTLLALLSRGRTFLIVAQFVDVVIVISMICLAAYALIAKSAANNRDKKP